MFGSECSTQLGFVLASGGIKDLIPWVGMVLGASLLVFLIFSLFRKIASSSERSTPARPAAPPVTPAVTPAAMMDLDRVTRPSPRPVQPSQLPDLPTTVRKLESLPDLSPTIQALDQMLKEQRPELYDNLLPGLSDVALAAIEETLGCPLPPILRDLYQWRNGQNEDFTQSFFYNRELMTAGEAVRAQSALNHLHQAGELHGQWTPTWLPFLDNGAGDHHCVDLSATTDGSTGAVVEFWHDNDDRTVLAPDLETWLSAFIAALGELEWHVNEGNWEPVDEDAFDAFMAERTGMIVSSEEEETSPEENASIPDIDDPGPDIGEPNPDIEEPSSAPTPTEDISELVSDISTDDRTVVMDRSSEE